MARVLSLAVLGAACLASVSSHGDESVVAVGKQFAASSTVEWEVKDANHPALGPIRFAARKGAAPTAVGGKKLRLHPNASANGLERLETSRGRLGCQWFAEPLASLQMVCLIYRLSRPRAR